RSPLPLPQLWSASPLRADLSGPEALGRCVPSVDGSGLARRIFTSQAWSVRPCEATAKAVEELAITKEWVLAKLKENAINALKVKGGSPVANRALELLGKELGMFIDRAEISQANEFCGKSLFRAVCELDLEGVVAKKLDDPYGTIRRRKGGVSCSSGGMRK